MKDAIPVCVSISSRLIDLLTGSLDPAVYEDKIEYETRGLISVENGWVLLRYEEPAGSGMEGSTSSLTFEEGRPGLLSMERSGSAFASLTFDSDHRRQNCAVNAAGFDISFTIILRSFENSLDPEKGGKIELDYIIARGAIEAERVVLKVTASPEEFGK